MPDRPILVTGAVGRIGGVGQSVVEFLCQWGLPVRAFVHDKDKLPDEFKTLDIEIVTGDLTHAEDVLRAIKGCKRMFFGMGVSSEYLEAALTTAAVARELGELEVFVNISQMTVSQMNLQKMTESTQQRYHWLAEQALNWSGLPVVHVRSTVFLQHPFFSGFAAESIAHNGTIRLPFGSAKTSPIDSQNVAEVIAKILANPQPHIGKIYELTGPCSQDMQSMALAYSKALGRTVTYVDMPFEQWKNEEFDTHPLPEHVYQHLLTMAKLHADNRYDRLTHDVELVTGHSPTSIEDYICRHPEIFQQAK